jgi:hypothetical protein
MLAGVPGVPVEPVEPLELAEASIVGGGPSAGAGVRRAGGACKWGMPGPGHGHG